MRALDSEGGREVMGLFRRLHAGSQTIQPVTHDHEVGATAERAVRMRDGRVLDHRTRSEPVPGLPSGARAGVVAEAT